MKPTIAISLLALAYATAVTAIPTPDAPGVYAVSAESDSGSIEARDPMMWSSKKFFPGLNGYKRDVEEEERNVEEGERDVEEGELDKRMMWSSKKFFPGLNGYKREIGKTDGQGQGQGQFHGHSFDQNQGSHTRPEGAPTGMPQGFPGPPGPPGPPGGPRQGMGGGNPGQGMPEGNSPFGDHGKPQ